MSQLVRRFTKEFLIIILISGTFLISYFLFSFISFYINTSSQYEEILEKRKLNLESIAETFNYLLQDEPENNIVECQFNQLNLPPEDNQKLRNLSTLLLTLTKSSNINFSLLRYNGVSLFNTRGTRYSCEIDPALEADYPVLNHTQILKTVMIRTISQGPFKITMGIPILTGKHVIEEFFSSIKVFFNDTISLTLIFIIFMAYYFNDLLFLYRILGKSNWKQLIQERANSEKSKVIIRFLNSMLKENNKLENENQKLKHGFESAYLRYIQSDEFLKNLENVIYIELDWKNHTPYVSKYGLNEVVKIRNRINHIGRVIVSRYNGLMLEAKSDMVSFIMESESLKENKLLALSCVRDFFKALTHLESTLDNKEIKINYRGTMVVGDFEFQVTDHNYNLNSLAYYISSRLSKVSNSPGHNITLLEKDTEDIKLLFELTQPITKSLKGLGDHTYCEINKFITIEEVLERSQWEQLQYFRDEDDLIKIMNYCREIIESKINSINNISNRYKLEHQSNVSSLITRSENLKKPIADNLIINILCQLRGFYLDELLWSNDIHDCYLKFLSSAEKYGDEITMASVVSLAKVLFSLNMNNQKVESYFKLAGNSEPVIQTVFNTNTDTNTSDKNHGPRVRANIIEVYNQLTNYQDQEWNESQLKYSNNRVISNVIIAACQDEVNEFYRKKIKELLMKVDDERSVSSGVYVLSYLYRLFYIKNKIYFSNNDWFKNIPNIIYQFTLHKSSLIKERANTEYQKLLKLD